MNRRYPVLFLCLLSISSYGQFLVNDVIGQSGDEISNSDITLNQTSGELVSSTINNTELTLTQGFQQTAQLIYIAPKAFLQGATIGTSNGLMRDNLRTLNYLPTISPYSPYIKESNSAFTISGNNAVVDWVTVKLRNSNHRIIAEKSALMQRDGDIVSADGISPLQLTAQNENYYVEVDHRNHLGSMTKNEIALSSTTTNLDFTDASILSYGNNSRIHLSSGSMALWAGDTNNSDKVKFLGPNNSTNIIKDFVLADSNNVFNSPFYGSKGYLNIDVDLNGTGKFQGTSNDSNIIKDNVLQHNGNIFNSQFYTVNTTVPSQN